jgi:hypothetical protein
MSEDPDMGHPVWLAPQSVWINLLALMGKSR